ncbi:MAG: hypothetical protein CfClM3_0946 [Methanobrevibacter sp. CfCl-M3]
MSKKYETANKKKYRRKCKICGKFFETNDPTTRWCSKKCLKQYNLIRVCKICGEEYIAKSPYSLYCDKHDKNERRLFKLNKEKKGALEWINHDVKNLVEFKNLNKQIFGE